MEEALQDAVDAEKLTLPVIEVDFEPYYPGDDQPDDMRLLDPVGKVTSLQAPHRIADAILRDSLLDGQPFRKSDEGKQVDMVSARNATVLFKLCPTALLLGMWDSTGFKGGLGAKFERALVSEIVGINAVYGVKTSSRIDPVGIRRDAGPLYRRPDGGYTIDPNLAVDEQKNGKPTGKKVLYKPNNKGQDVLHDPKETKFADQGRPSQANHGNVVPDIDCRRDQNGNPVRDKEGNLIPVGGVTIDHAVQTIVLSLPALRRLHFPLKGNVDKKVDVAAQTVLAALGLCAAALADEAGMDLRSRCLLYSEKELTWELLDRKSDKTSFELSADEAVTLLTDAVAAATEAGLPWLEKPLVLQPSDQLVKLVVKSQHLAVQQGNGGEGGE